jgi:hypothetical protein
MDYRSKNGNGGAVILPPTPQVLRGQSLAHRNLDARKRACLAADVIDGMVRFVPTQKELAAIFDVNVVYIELARRLSLHKRAAIVRGLDRTSFAELSKPQRQLQLKLPAPHCASITNAYLENVIRTVGIERMLEIAAAVEQHT